MGTSGLIYQKLSERRAFTKVQTFWSILFFSPQYIRKETALLNRGYIIQSHWCSFSNFVHPIARKNPLTNNVT